jgi:hypothetical protein
MQYRFDIVDRANEEKIINSIKKGSQRSSNTMKSSAKPVELMKSSFGPIILQNEMSYS